MRREKKTGLKVIMKYVIAKEIRSRLAAITQDMAAEHDVRTHVWGEEDMKLVHNGQYDYWEFEITAYIIVDKKHCMCRVEGLLHDTGTITIMRIHDKLRDTNVWSLYDKDDKADENRQIEYKAIA